MCRSACPRLRDYGERSCGAYKGGGKAPECEARNY